METGRGAIQAQGEFDLAAVPAGDRLGYWMDQVCSATAEADCELADDSARLSGHLSHLRIADISINRLRVSAQAFRRTPYHVSRAPEEVFAILMQRDGRSCIEYGGQRRVLEPGDVVLNSGLEPGVLRMEDGAELVLTVVSSLFMRRLVGHAHEKGFLAIARDTPAAPIIGATLNALLHGADQLSSAAALHLRDGLLSTVAAASAPDEPARGGLVAYHRARALRFIGLNLFDPRLDMAMIAAALELSVGHLHRLFPRSEGSLMRRVWRERLVHCRRLLEDRSADHLTVAELAWRCGFASPAHFSRAFAEQFGCSPRAWRQTSRAGSSRPPEATA